MGTPTTDHVHFLCTILHSEPWASRLAQHCGECLATFTADAKYDEWNAPLPADDDVEVGAVPPDRTGRARAAAMSDDYTGDPN